MHRPSRTQPRRRRGKRKHLKLQLESLERREMLAGDPWLWFDAVEDIPRLTPQELTAAGARPDPGAIGPHELVASEWIVQLNDHAADRLTTLESLELVDDQYAVEVSVISGLGSRGWLLVRGQGVTDVDVLVALEASDSIVDIQRNTVIEGQLAPNDDEFQAGRQPGFQTVGLPDAWDSFASAPSVGGSSVVVGVVDGGIDATHPDLFLNVWLNQGEIPASFRDQLVDQDGDGLITFYDLNNLRHTSAGIVVANTGVLATGPELTGPTPFASGPNAGFVRDVNGNQRIDAVDLLEDVTWADGFDTDNNTFFDDLFGANFRSGSSDPFPSNLPLDELGHGTHVAGTIGAIGNNDFGIAGVNWQTSLMSLRILDNNNQSDAAAAIRAINYATQMRSGLRRDDQGRVESGADVRVLNNSWGQPGGADLALATAIDAAADEEILFVAAAGNGNILGQGVDNDLTPFFPASYDAENVIAVAALANSPDRLAPFSNFGATSVDIAAPGVGVLSTGPGGAFRLANGTSMATPHVAGAAALIWSALPGASMAEVKQAILSTATPLSIDAGSVSTGGYLDLAAAIDADVFAPAGQLAAKPTITTSSTGPTEFTVTYDHRSGIDASTLGDDDVQVTRRWGNSEPINVTLKPGSVQTTPDGVAATYRLDAPGSGSFSSDVTIPIDATAANTIASQVMVQGISESNAHVTVSLDIDHDEVGQLSVTLIAPDGSRANLFSQIGGSGDDFSGTTLDDDAAMEISTGSAPFTGVFRPAESIDSLVGPLGPDGVWTLEVEDSAAGQGGTLLGWSIDFSGTWDALDFGDYVVSTVAGNVQAISGEPIDDRDVGSFLVRIEDDPSVIYVESRTDFPNSGSLREAIIAANAAAPQPRTIILDSGVHTLAIPAVADPASTFPSTGPATFCGAEQNTTGWSGPTSGDLDILGSVHLIGNQNDLTTIDGAGIDRVFKVHSGAGLELSRMTVRGGVSPSDQGGGGILSMGDLTLRDVVVRENLAIGNALSDPIRGGGVAAWDGTATILQSWITSNESDYGAGVFYCGDASGTISRSTVSGNVGGGFHSHSESDLQVDNSTFSGNRGGQGAIFNGSRDGFDVSDGASSSPSVSADGRYIAFESSTGRLVAGDSNDQGDVFIYDRLTDSIRLVSLRSDGTQGNGQSFAPSISADGRYVAFVSLASNLVDDDTNGSRDVFVADLETGELERVSQNAQGDEANGSSYHPAISADGRYVAFSSYASNLTPGDVGGFADVFVFDRDLGEVERVSVAADGSGGDSNSGIGLGGSLQGEGIAISSDGQKVAFASAATNLVPGDTNGRPDVFVFDRASDSMDRGERAKRWFRIRRCKWKSHDQC